MKREFFLPGRNQCDYDISCIEWPCEKPRAVLPCLHGFAGDKYSAVVHALARRMQSERVRVLTFDWPGHGNSPVCGDCLSVDNCLADLETVLRYADADGLPLWLFATSFGAFLGVNEILRRPELFEKIILRSPALKMPEIFRGFLSDEERAVLDGGGTVDLGYRRPLRLGADFYEDLCRHRVFDAPLPAGLPGLVIQGDRDEIVDPRDAAAYAEKNGLRLHLVRGADHRYRGPGQPEEIVDTAAAFLLGGET